MAYCLAYLDIMAYPLMLSLPNLGFPGGSAGKESACNEGDLDSIPDLRRFPGERKDYPLQYSGLEKSMDRIVRGDHKELDTTEQLSLSLYQIYDTILEVEGKRRIRPLLSPPKETVT